MDDVAYAVQFTTQDPTAEMAHIVHRMRTGLDAAPLETSVVQEARNSRFTRYRGELRVPIWQHGEEPYTASGGAFVIDDDGWPTLWRMASVEFTLTIPRSGDMPENGWPVVIYAHSTGGNRTTFATDATDRNRRVTSRGPAWRDCDQPALPASLQRLGSGTGRFQPESDSGRTSFRQAALEQSGSPARTGPAILVDDDGQEFMLDPSRIAYMGHSHGAEIGIMAVPSFGDRVAGSVLSSGGGGLSIALLERDAGDFDIQGILEDVLQLGPGETLTSTHPAVGLVQMIAEATDPLHYARYWFAEQPRWEAEPQDVLLFQGLEDAYTPPPTIGALTAAGSVPILSPVAETWMAQDFVPVVGDSIPARNNVESWNGSSVTAGLLQYPGYGHFPVFEDEGAMTAYREFLARAVEGVPEVIDR